MSGVGAFSNSSEAIQRGDSQAGGEVSVRATADGRFFQFPAQLLCNRCSFLVQRGDTRAPLHRWAVKGSLDFQLAFAIKGFERSELAVDYRSVFHVCHANIERSNCLRRN